jgi:hypothetical protein
MYKTSAVNSKSAVSLVTSPCEPDHVYSGLRCVRQHALCTRPMYGVRDLRRVRVTSVCAGERVAQLRSRMETNSVPF